MCCLCYIADARTNNFLVRRKQTDIMDLLDFFVFGYCLVMDSRKKRLKV